MTRRNPFLTRWFDRRPWVYRLFKRIAILHSAFCAVVVATCLVPGSPLLPDVVAITGSIGAAFVYWPVAVVGAISMQADAGSRLAGFLPLEVVRQVWRRVPKFLVIGAVAVFYGVVGVGAADMGSLSGQPETINGQHVLNNHGRLTPVDDATYRNDLALEERLFAGVGLGFAALGVVLLLAAESHAHERAA